MNILSFCYFFFHRYVQLVEADTHSVLTLHTKNEDGTYCRRSCSSRPTVIPPNILPHLYGQLAQTGQVSCYLLIIFIQKIFSFDIHLFIGYGYFAEIR